MRHFLNAFANRFMPMLLRSPLHFLASGRVMLVTFTGRKSGIVYTTPVEYCRDNERVIFFTQRGRAWWKNLRDGASITLRIEGRDVHGQAQAITNEDMIRLAFTCLHPYMTINPAEMVMVQVTLVKATERYASASS